MQIYTHQRSVQLNTTCILRALVALVDHAIFVHHTVLLVHTKILR